ncbi:hypothetical protein [Nocardia sp. NPDC004260]
MLRTPALLAGVFVAAAALYFSMLLTVDRAPADALPTTPASADCAMFCTATEAPKHVDTAATSDEPRACWLFCEPARHLGLL